MVVHGKQELTCPIVQKNPSKRIVEGPVLIPDEEDVEGDTLSADEIEELAHKFLRDYRNVDIMHTLNNVAEPVESWISKSARTFESDGEIIVIPEGSWWLSSYVESDETWQAVLEGELNGYSIMAVQEAVVKQFEEAVPDEAGKEELISQVQTAAKNGLISTKDIETVKLDQLGDSIVVNAVSLVDEPAVPKARFAAVKSVSGRKKDDFIHVSTKARETARDPSDIEYDGTDEAGSPDWDDTPKGLAEVYEAWLDYIDNPEDYSDADEISTADETPDEFKRWVAKGSVIGEVSGNEWEDIRAFPVVNYETYNLHEGGLDAANRLAPTAEIPEGLAEDIQDTVQTLLEDEFNEDEGTETTQNSKGEPMTDATFKALEGTLDEKLQTRREAVQEAIEDRVEGMVQDDASFDIWMNGLFEDRAVFELDVWGVDESDVEGMYQVGYSYKKAEETAELSGEFQPVEIEEVLTPVTKSLYFDLKYQVMTDSESAAYKIEDLEDEGLTDAAFKFVNNYARENGITPRASQGFSQMNPMAAQKQAELGQTLEDLEAAQKAGRTISDENLEKLIELRERVNEMLMTAVDERDGINSVSDLTTQVAEKTDTDEGGDLIVDEEEVRSIVEETLEEQSAEIAEEAATKAVSEFESKLEELDAATKGAGEEGEDGEEDDEELQAVMNRLDEMEDKIGTLEAAAAGSNVVPGQDAATKSKGGDGDEDETDEDLGVERDARGRSQDKIYN